MGGGLTAEQKEANELSRKLEEQNRNDFAQANDKVKLLLLGAGESGKSTIFKQMKILYGAGFSKEELEAYQPTIYSNTIVAMKQILLAIETFELKGEVGCMDSFDAINSLEDDNNILPETMVTLGAHIKALWADAAVQKAWERRAEYWVVETNAVFFEKIDEIAAVGFTPSADDILACRVRTSGIIEEQYVIDDVNFVMFDVGGQRNERKKWIHCFDDVNAVIFVVALSEYDQMLFEDNQVNRMVEAIALFDEICNSRWFINTSMILFLNKRDLFENKITKREIKTAHEQFSDYQGKPNDYDEGIEYFKQKFLEVNKSTGKQIFTHVTCATDKGNVQAVFNACKEIILRDNLQGAGFME